MFRKLAVLSLLIGIPALPAEPGFKALFDGKTLTGWKLVDGVGRGYVVEDGIIVCPADSGGKLMTEEEFSNFVLRFEYRMDAGGNNGINIRAPFQGRPAYVGMEIQIIDDNAGKWKSLRAEQRNGSLYDVIAPLTTAVRAIGEWNEEEIVADGRRITVKLNGVIVLDVNLDTIKDPAILEKHPGLSRPSGHLGLLGHRTRTEFRNLRVKRLP